MQLFRHVMNLFTSHKLYSHLRSYVDFQLKTFCGRSVVKNKMTDDSLVHLVTLCENEKAPNWADHVASACWSVKNGKIIAVPTDTIYGIAGLAQSTSAVNSLYDIKGRDTTKPIAICVGDVADVQKWGRITVPQALLTLLLPGPVTVVLERTAALNPHLNPGTSLVGIRVPDYGFVRDVARRCAEPLALTSANLSNGPSAVNIQEFSELWPQLDTVYDGGILNTTATSQTRLGSTVVDLSQMGYYTIIRDGSAYKRTVHSLKQFGLCEGPAS